MLSRMKPSPAVELVVASFDDPLVHGLLLECGDAPLPPDAGLVFLLARLPAGPVGCAGLRRLGDDVAGVERLRVRPAHRGTGLLGVLLSGVEDLARRRGFTVVRAEAGDPAAAGTYTAGGYVHTATARGACLEKSLLAALPGDRLTGPRG